MQKQPFEASAVALDENQQRSRVGMGAMLATRVPAQHESHVRRPVSGCRGSSSRKRSRQGSGAVRAG